MGNLTCEQLGESRQQPGVQTMTLERERPLAAQRAGKQSSELAASYVVSDSSTWCWKDVLWGLQIYSRKT